MVWLEIGHLPTVEPYLHWGLLFNFLIEKKFDLFYWRSVLREIDQKNNWYIHNIILLLLLQEYQV